MDQEIDRSDVELDGWCEPTLQNLVVLYSINYIDGYATRNIRWDDGFHIHELKSYKGKC